jgi:hypothetical protein
MRHCDDPAELSPEQRRRELADILAQGVLRLRQRRRRTGEPPTTAPNSSAGRLEVSGETVLSVHTG